MENTMKTSQALVAALFIPALSMSACATDLADEQNIHSSATELVQLQGDSCVTLLAGQTIPAGTVCSSIQGDDLKITYETSDGWLLDEAHLWTGISLASMPQTNSGNPKLGNFPYNAGSLGGVTSFSFSVPLSTFSLSADMTACDPVTAYVVAHAAVKKQRADGSFQTETGYGEGTRLVRKGNWATWFSSILTCVEDEPVVATCETAFAYGEDLASCFIDSGIVSTNRWGWFNGPIGPGTYSFEIHAGAGQCDLDKGTLVGSLNVSYDGSTADVAYTMLPGFTMDETHLYVGSEPLPRQGGSYTVAPGQYGNVRTLSAATSDSYRVSGLDGNIYVVAHAVACSVQWPQ
jgi:hypothetical protein